jgi:cysteine desulfurase/selenocysteine lyase
MRDLAQRAEPRSIATYRNATEALNAVMYSLLTEFRDGDNVVTTMMEHNSTSCRGTRCAARSCRASAAGWSAAGPFDHGRRARPRPPRRPVDARTKLVCCTGASNFLGTSRRCPVRAIADAAAATAADRRAPRRCCWSTAAHCPDQRLDVQALDVDYLAFSFHKCSRRSGRRPLRKEHLLEHGCRSSTAAT